MAETFATLQAEFYARGFDYLNDGTGSVRAKRWINQAYQEVNAAYPWPFQMVTTTGAAPLTISDLNQIETVVDTVTLVELKGLPRETLIQDVGSDLTSTGTPSYWYLEGLVLKVYPVNTDVLSVRYVQTPADMSADSDIPNVPTQYTNIIVDLAVSKALTDSDNLMAAYAVRQAAREQLDQMMQAEVWRGESEHTRVQGYSEDS